MDFQILFLLRIPFFISIGNSIFYFHILFFIPAPKHLCGFDSTFSSQVPIYLPLPVGAVTNPSLYHIKIPKPSNIPVLLLPEPLRIKSLCSPSALKRGLGRYFDLFWFLMTGNRAGGRLGGVSGLSSGGEFSGMRLCWKLRKERCCSCQIFWDI